MDFWIPLENPLFFILKIMLTNNEPHSSQPRQMHTEYNVIQRGLLHADICNYVTSKNDLCTRPTNRSGTKVIALCNYVIHSTDIRGVFL